MILPASYLRWTCSGLVVLLALLLAVGCGPRTAKVSGKVTYKGAPVPAGTVTFHGDNGVVQAAWLTPSGSYTINGVRPGSFKVSVMPSQPPRAPAPARGKTSASHPSGKGAADVAAIPVVPIPEKYKDPEKSGLSYTVVAGEQSIDIPLQ
jgi:hypothetical protein